MKKLFVILSSVLVLGATANAQETFYPGWNFGLQAGANYTVGYTGIGNLLSYPTLALNAGYEFNPWFGLRANLSGWQAKGVGIDADNTVNGGQLYKFNYVQLAADAMFDFCNMVRYRSERTVNPYIFLGLGANYRFNNGAADAGVVFPEDYKYNWTNGKVGLVGRLGLGVNFRCSDAVKISLEVVDNVLPNGFNAVYNNQCLPVDHNVSALLGLKFTFGQANKKKAAIAAAAEAAAAAAAAEAAARAAREKAIADSLAAERARAEAERLAAEKAAREAEAAKAAALAAAKKAVADALDNESAYPRFIIGTSKLTKDTKDRVAVAAEVLKVNPDVDVVLTGYADKETGSAAGNLKLSEKRANAINDALVGEGVEASQLEAKWVGDTEVPFEGAKPAQKRTVTFKVK